MANSERLRRAWERLLELEREGATLDDILNGEIGRRWIEEDCDGDRELAMRAFLLAHPSARPYSELEGY